MIPSTLIQVLGDMYDPDELVDVLGVTSHELVAAFLERAYEYVEREGIEIPETADGIEEEEEQVLSEDEGLPSGFHFVPDEEIDRDF